MEFPEYSKMIEAAIANSKASVTGEGNKLEAVVISEGFAELSPVKRHQAVYKIFSEQLASGVIHALSIKAYTPKEWEDV